jgi:HAD superfamily hydrolase (TIGR01509 family)
MKMPDPTHRRAALLDIDGTLVDSNLAHARAWSEGLREFGFAYEPEQILPLIGMGGDKVLPITTGVEKTTPRGQKITDRIHNILHERHLPRVRPFAGARELLLELRARGVLLGVATSASESDCGRLLSIANVRDLVDVVVTSSDAEESKPDPDIVQAALRRTGLPSRAVVLIGDTPYDVEAAVRAGIACVAVRSGGWGDAALAGAVAVYEDVAQVLRQLDTAPLATWLEAGLAPS